MVCISIISNACTFKVSFVLQKSFVASVNTWGHWIFLVGTFVYWTCEVFVFNSVYLLREVAVSFCGLLDRILRVIPHGCSLNALWITSFCLLLQPIFDAMLFLCKAEWNTTERLFCTTHCEKRSNVQMLSENTEGFTETNHEGCSWYCFGVFEFFLVGLQAIGSIKCWKDEASHNWTFQCEKHSQQGVNNCGPSVLKVQTCCCGTSYNIYI